MVLSMNFVHTFARENIDVQIDISMCNVDCTTIFPLTLRNNHAIYLDHRHLDSDPPQLLSSPGPFELTHLVCSPYAPRHIWWQSEKSSTRGR